MNIPARLTYTQAKAWARSQDPLIDGIKGWRALSKASRLPPGVPANPWKAYHGEFEGWGEFLGTGRIAAMRRNFLPYAKCKRWAQKQQPKIVSKADWFERIKLGKWPQDIPTDPRSHYGKTFEGWGTFLGTGVIANQKRKLLTYPELRAWVQSQTPAIHDHVEYANRVKALNDPRLPVSPPSAYKAAFKGWGALLGRKDFGNTSLIERILKQELASIFPVDGRRVVRVSRGGGRKTQVDILIPDWGLVIEYDGSHFHGGKEANDRAKTADIQKEHPGWVVVRVREAPLEKLDANRDVLVEYSSPAIKKTQAVVSKLLELGIVPRGHITKAKSYIRRKTLAVDPQKVMRWRTYDEAKAWVIALDKPVRTGNEWRGRCQDLDFLPPDIPTAVEYVYGKAFKSWGDFLGTGRIHTGNRRYRSYEAATVWARKSGIKRCQEWSARSVAGKLPKDLPSNPNATYQREWQGWGEFLGTGAVHPKNRQWRTLEEVRTWAAAQSPPVSTQKEWMVAKDREDFPDDIPKCLYNLYKGEFEGYPLLKNLTCQNDVRQA